jgi:hypothetical protein
MTTSPFIPSSVISFMIGSYRILFCLQFEYGKTTEVSAPLDPRYWLLPTGIQANRPKAGGGLYEDGI